MDEVRDVLPFSALIGMPVLSRMTGNKLGGVQDLIIDRVNGVLCGVLIAADNADPIVVPYESIYSFGPDAIMADSDNAIGAADGLPGDLPRAREHLVGTKVITEGGTLIGQIANVFVTLQPPPLVVYEIRESILDKLFRREIFVLASAGNALSDDAERLVVPDGTAETAASSISELINQALVVRTFSPTDPVSRGRGPNDTWVPGANEVETISHSRDEEEEETILRSRDDEEDTLLRWPRTADS